MPIINNPVYITTVNPFNDFTDGENLNFTRLNQILQALEDLDSKIPIKPNYVINVDTYKGAITASALDAKNILALIQAGDKISLYVETTNTITSSPTLKVQSLSISNAAIYISYKRNGFFLDSAAADGDNEDNSGGTASFKMDHRGKGYAVSVHRVVSGNADFNFFGVDPYLQCIAPSFFAMSKTVVNGMNYSFKLPQYTDSNMTNFLVSRILPANCSHFHLTDSTSSGIFKFTTNTSHVGQVADSMTADLAAQKLSIDGINLKTMISTLGGGSSVDMTNIQSAILSNSNAGTVANIGANTRFHAYYAP